MRKTKGYTMLVHINGEQKDIQPNTTIQELLSDLKILDKTMAAAINMNIIKKDLWKTHIIKENDKLEFLNFVGGG